MILSKKQNNDNNNNNNNNNNKIIIITIIISPTNSLCNFYHVKTLSFVYVRYIYL